MRGSIQDLSDSQAAKMRALLVEKSHRRRDVLGLAMALRSSRLMQASRIPSRRQLFLGDGTSRAQRQQLALETLQLWAPLSFQMGMSAQLPELEVYSYSQLFPRSFGSFLSWYGHFRPLARRLIRRFREDLEAALRRDPLVARSCSKVAIQSRLKTPPSAFKKMLKSAKQRSQLFDIVGVRVIVTHRATDPASVEDRSAEGDSEEQCIQRVYRVVASMSGGWSEDRQRFKDYVTSPKPSGYQSVHTSLRHNETGIFIEVQIRSERMHRVAEFGSAAHSNYKALLLGSPTTD